MLNLPLPSLDPDHAPLPLHRWMIRLELESFENYGDCDRDIPRRLVMELSDEHVAGKLPANECIAMTMSQLCEMLLASGILQGQSNMKKTVKAFGK